MGGNNAKKRPNNKVAMMGAVKKSPAGTAVAAPASAVVKRKGDVKDTASFLKQRQSMKVKNLKLASHGLGSFNADDELRHSVSSIAALTGEADSRCDAYARLAGPAVPENGYIRGDTVEVVEGATAVGHEAENNRKKFFTELRKVIRAADVIIEVLDARDPQSCRCLELEREATAEGKRIVLVLNKIDLVPKEAVEAWMKVFKRSFPTIAFKAARQGVTHPTHASVNATEAPEGLLRSTHAVVGADEVIQLLKNYSRTAGGSKSNITAGVVGFPNTGKSSVINSLKRNVAVHVGAKPGMTKEMQEVKLDSKVTLIDSPGVVFAGASDDAAVVLRNVVSIDQVTDPMTVVEALTQKTPREALLSYYGFERDFATPNEFLIHVAQVRGCVERKRGLDLQKAARLVITDWTSGKFRYFVMPPTADVGLAEMAAVGDTAEVVSTLAPALDLDSMFAGDDGSQPVVLGAPGTFSGDVAMEDDSTANMQTVNVDMDL